MLIALILAPVFSASPGSVGPNEAIDIPIAIKEA